MFAQHRFTFQHASLAWFSEQVDSSLFAFSFPAEKPELLASIAECGVIQPLVVRGADSKHRALLISGHRRLAALAKLDDGQNIPMLVLPAHDISLPAALQLYLAENLSTRPFNLIERARILYFCLRQLRISKEEVQQQWLPRVGLKPSLNLLTSHLKVLQLPEACLNYVMRENLNLKTAEHLADVPTEALDILFPLITKFQIGGNRLEEILAHLQTVAKRDGKPLVDSLEDLLVMPEISHLLSASTTDIPQKLEALRALVRRRAFPMLSGMEEVFTHRSEKLALPHGVSVKAPAYFEGDRLDIQFKFKTPQELKWIAQKLLESADKPELTQMLDLL